MDQPSFADLEYQGKKRKTRRELFLERMDGLIPWQRLEDRIRPFYPKAGRGRHPYPLAAMLRVHCVQLFYNLSDPGMEDLLYESDPVRGFVGLKLTGYLPDETTILNFRHNRVSHVAPCHSAFLDGAADAEGHTQGIKVIVRHVSQSLADTPAQLVTGAVQRLQ